SLIRSRYAFIKRSAEADYHKKRADFLASRGKDGFDAYVAGLDAEHTKEIAQLDQFLKTVLSSNEPSLLPEGSFEELIKSAETMYADIDGNPQPFLSDDEVRYLTIRKGSLDEAERLEIESHVTHTYKFLLQIPWTKELSSLPVNAYGHHEKLN